MHLRRGIIALHIVNTHRVIPGIISLNVIVINLIGKLGFLLTQMVLKQEIRVNHVRRGIRAVVD